MLLIRRPFFIILCAIVALGCSLSSAGIPGLLATPTSALAAVTVTAALGVADTATSAPTEAAPTATQAATLTPQPTGTATSLPGAAVSYANINLVVPNGLASDTANSTGTDVEFPYINPSNGDMPQHAKIVIHGYPVQGNTLDPQVMAFPADQYAQYSDLTQQLITALKSFQFMDGQPLPAGLPDGTLTAHVGTVVFANGKGIRYLTQFDQAALPVNNHELIYYFHGLTGDGSTYVEVILPVQAAFLAPDDNPASTLPAGGIPFDMNDLSTYFQAVANKLNATPPDQFSPSLSTLDALVQSISIK